MKMKNKETNVGVKSENIETPKKKKLSKGKIILIVVASIIGVLLFISPFVFLVVALFMDSVDVKYEVINNTVVVEEDEAVIRDVKGFYSEKEEMYIIEGYIDNNTKDNYLDLKFNLYDKDGIIIGEVFSSNDMSEVKTYKFKAYYSEYDAKDIVSFKLKKIEDLF